MLKDTARLSSVNEEQVLSAKLVKQFRTWGYVGDVKNTTLADLLDWLYYEKGWLVIIDKDGDKYAFHVEAKEGGIKYYPLTADTESSAIKQVLNQAAMACRAKDEDDYYFPEN